MDATAFFDPERFIRTARMRRDQQGPSTVTHATLLVIVIRLDKSEPNLHYFPGMKLSKKKVGYQQFPEAEADEEDNTVLHSAGAVSKLLQIACL